MAVSLKQIFDNLGTGLVIVAACVLLWRMAPQSQVSPTVNRIEDVADLSLHAGEVRHVLGTGDVILIEFADFQCPYCATHATSTGPALEEEFVKSGQIQMIFAHYPLSIHPYARKAGEAAVCAEKQGRFWELYHRLFKHPSELDETSLVRHAEAVGLNRPAFVSCLSTGETAADIEADVNTARRLGVSSTPLFFLGRRSADGDIRLLKRIKGTAPIATFRTAIAEVAAESAK